MKHEQQRSVLKGWMKLKGLMGAAVALGVMASASLASAQESEAVEEEAEAEAIVFGLDLFPYVGTSSALPDAPRVVSFNMVGGLSGGTRLFELGGALNINTGDVRGVQVGGAANINRASRAGVQVGGALNLNGGQVSGVGVGGAANINGGDVAGVQVGGALNVNRGDVAGVQVGGAANINGGDFRGVQVGGALNLTRGDMHGLQIGAVNITGGKARGFQIGAVNIADGEHVGIAAVGIYRGGYVYPQVDVSDEGFVQAGIRHGAGAFYHSYALGTQAFGRGEGQGPGLALSIRMGWRKALSEAVEFSLDAGATSLIGEGGHNPFSLYKVRPMVAVELGERLALFGGPTLSLDVANSAEGALPEGLLGGWMFGDQVQLRPGATVGLRVLTR
ncbi:hypothetical protein FRC98_11955 [Lujinxingia vulgaris]|uniref:Uncharacterized protein n=1 Tax=Lujinxingia vulgaris TaxID=2600176 RepID=A0A5C6X480_9DELT|nr:hypothetical protein [Lujinxingia vulgaris]TXD36546.1 hypothetical protein FRC98_11955 [Lujinxingia vulgaris]